MVKKISFFILLFAILVVKLQAKDNLIPSLSKSTETIFDYKKNKERPFYQLNNKSDDIVENKPSVTINPPKTQQQITAEKPEIKLDTEIKAEATHEATPNSETETKQPELKESHFFEVKSFKTQAKLDCPITPILKNTDHIPLNFQPTNNLRRYITSPDISAGNIIYVKGRVLDVNCTPIAGAIVNLWQNDAYGDFDQDIDFVGNGTATADNLGNFSFITILPSEVQIMYNEKANSAPHINLKITHQDFPDTITRIYFPLMANNHDLELNSLDKFNQELITSELIAVNQRDLNYGYFMLFDVTINGVSKFRKL